MHIFRIPPFPLPSCPTPKTVACPGTSPTPDHFAGVREMSTDIQLDALPYIDQGYEEPGVREAVRRAWKIHRAKRCQVLF